MRTEALVMELLLLPRHGRSMHELTANWDIEKHFLEGTTFACLGNAWPSGISGSAFPRVLLHIARPELNYIPARKHGIVVTSYMNRFLITTWRDENALYGMSNNANLTSHHMLPERGYTLQLAQPQSFPWCGRNAWERLDPRS